MKLLSILIPIRNVGDVMSQWIPELLEIIDGYDCEVIISDNASVDNTEEICKQYPQIKYTKNETNLGGSGNIFKLLSMATGKYSICIGKNRIFNKDNFKEFYELLEHSDYDFISINSPWRVKLPSKEYKDINEILDDLGWHLTLVSSIVFNNKILKNMDVYKKYIDSEMLHAAILYHCVLNGSTLYYDERPFTKSFEHANSKSQWLGDVVLYMKKMVDLMTQFNSDKIKESSRYKWILDLSGPNHPWFDEKFYVWVEQEYSFKLSQCFKYRNYFKYFSPVPWQKVVFIVLSERFLFSKLRIIKNFFYTKIKEGKRRKIRLLGGLIKFNYKKAK